MTYAEAWAICRAARPELDWSDPLYEESAEHIRLADYDFQVGIIADVTEYDAK